MGIAGKVVLENGRIKTISHISSINIRVSHQVIGCGDDVMRFIIDNENIHNTLIISPPRCGKTTLFNLLTGTNQKIGNWPGVTIEKKTGKIYINEINKANHISLLRAYKFSKTNHNNETSGDVMNGIDVLYIFLITWGGVGALYSPLLFL